jgi:hypothetical protein
MACVGTGYRVTSRSEPGSGVAFRWLPRSVCAPGPRSTIAALRAPGFAYRYEMLAAGADRWGSTSAAGWPATTILAEFVTGYEDGDLAVHRATVRLDERQDGEPVTRVVLLLSDPSGDTWDIDAVRALPHARGRRATELELPAVTVTLVPESEAEAFAS